MMGALSILIIAILVVVLIVAIAFAWMHDVRTERFRANLEPGQRVYYSIGQSLSFGIIKEVGTEAVRLIDTRSLIVLNVSIRNIYEP
jgi:hypothetical protein